MIFRLGTALGLLLGLAGTAHAQLDLDRLQRLVEAGRMEAAYELAAEHRTESEGRLRFDLYYGIAAIDAGYVAEGVFALERVLMRRPGLDRARLELARGYFLLGEDRRARTEFRTVLAHQPPEAVAAAIERYLEAIRRRAGRYETVVTAYAELAGGWDSNINSATDADSVAIFDGALQLDISDDSQARSDAFWRVGAGGEVRQPLTPHMGVFAGVDARRRGHADGAAFDTGRLSARAGWQWRGDVSRLRLTGRAQRFFLHDGPYQDSAGGGADFRYTLTDTTAASVFGQVDWLDYADQPIRDSRLWTAGLGLHHLFRGAYRPAASLTLFGGHEAADEDSDAARAVAERDLYGARAGLRLVVHPEVSIDVAAQARRSEYAEEHAFFGEERRETYYQGELGISWQFARHWQAGPRVRYSDNHADIALYDYQRTQAWLRLRYDHF
jgi:hypothetical protein